MKIFFPTAGLIIGIIAGIYIPFVFPAASSTYVAMGILACMDSLLGGIRAEISGKFNFSIFISGFFGNAIISMLLIWAGDKLNMQLGIAGIVVFGGRLFQNFSYIRRSLLNKNENNENV